MKSEPGVFSIQDLERQRRSLWDGVRNYQARNFMTQDMKIDDRILFYHSNAQPPGIAGLARVVTSAQPDPSQFARKSEYFEPRATPQKPVWFGVTIEFEERFSRLISLQELRDDKKLKGLLVTKPGVRLSIQPVSPEHFKCILKLAHR